MSQGAGLERLAPHDVLDELMPWSTRPMNDPTATFSALRPRLQGIAYRMLGSVAEAEEPVQDVWLRCHDADRATIQNAEAWLVTITTRLSIDRLRAAKVQREHYVGFWLPEPVLSESPATPEQLLARADDASNALTTLLEALPPEARTAFLLHEVFDADSSELASALGRSEAACRALVEHARAELRRTRSSLHPLPSTPIHHHPGVPMTQRIDCMKQSPALFKKFLEFSMATKDSAIEESLRDLVAIRASQMNGCGFCVDMHVKQATIHGERALRLHHLAIWRESTLFSPRERAALAWTEVLTRLPEHGVPDELFDRVRTQLSEKELSDLSFEVMAINGWNRVNIGFQSVPGSLDAAWGLDKAKLA